MSIVNFLLYPLRSRHPIYPTNGKPSNSTGNDGEVWLDITTGTYYFKQPQVGWVPVGAGGGANQGQSIPGLGYQKNIQQDLTGQTTIKTLVDILVPANSIDPNGAVRLSVNMNSPAGRAGSWTTSATFGGQQLFSTTQPNTIGSLSGSIMIRNMNSRTAQKAAPYFDLGPNGTAVNTFAVNTAVDQHIIISGQLTNAADTMSLIGATLEYLNPGS